ncbi:MAG: pyruvate dehydrogenase E2 component (dihydrolipoamide acetyltransferase), partial [Francisella sp.]
MSIEIVKVPDIGDYDAAEIIEIAVKVGDVISEEDTLITLETDKASMDVPSPVAGKITKITVNMGDKVAEGNAIMEVEVEGASSDNSAVKKEPKAEVVALQDSGSTQVIEVQVPDIGDYAAAEIIEIAVKVGDEIVEEDTLMTLETDKASMDVPSPVVGKVIEVLVKLGDKVGEGHLIIKVEAKGAAPVVASEPAKVQAPKQEAKATPVASQSNTNAYEVNNSNAHASPAVRKLARILNVDLSKVKASGRKGRVSKEDCYSYIKNAVTQVQSGKVASNSGAGLDLLADPVID